jgi:hypothetical protein
MPAGDAHGDVWKVASITSNLHFAVTPAVEALGDVRKVAGVTGNLHFAVMPAGERRGAVWGLVLTRSLPRRSLPRLLPPAARLRRGAFAIDEWRPAGLPAAHAVAAANCETRWYGFADLR